MKHKHISLFKPFVTKRAAKRAYDILQTGWIGEGPLVKEFEEKVGNIINAKYCLALNSGTAALHLSAKLINLKEGDEFITTAQTMMASGKAVLILVDEVSHGKELSIALGIPFATGLDKKSQGYVDDLNAGKIPGLVGTDGKVGEGTDTQNVDVLILANFVASKGPVTQAVGRGLRKQGVKTKCLILDYIPMGSTMLTRHANNRIGFYEEITDKVKVITL